MRALFFLTSLFIMSNVMATEEPKYTLLEKSESFELRSYAPQIIAQVKVTGDMDTASSQGFPADCSVYFWSKSSQPNDFYDGSCWYRNE